ncbi:MAG: hypothetical protein ACFCUO_04470 [Rhodospirillales bacterium]
MLADLYDELVNLHFQVQRLAADQRQKEAHFVFERILEVEGQINEIPAMTLEDAAVKLRFLRVEIGAEISDRQRRMLDEAIAIVRRASGH